MKIPQEANPDLASVGVELGAIDFTREVQPFSHARRCTQPSHPVQAAARPLPMQAQMRTTPEFGKR